MATTLSTRIIKTLKSHKEGVTVSELSKAAYGRNGVHNRNKLYRMVAFMRRTGVKITFKNGKYHLLDDGSHNLFPD